MKRLVSALALLLLASSSWGATCVVTEHNYLPTDWSSRAMQVPWFPGVTEQVVTYTTSTASANFNSQTKYIGFICSAKAHFALAVSATATANNPWVPADTWMFIAIDTGDEIAFYDGTS